MPERGAGQFENGQCRRVVKLQGHHNEGEPRKGCKEHEKFLKCCQVFPGTGWGRGDANILPTEPLKRLALEGAAPHSLLLPFTGSNPQVNENSWRKALEVSLSAGDFYHPERSRANPPREPSLPPHPASPELLSVSRLGRPHKVKFFGSNVQQRKRQSRTDSCLNEFERPF